MDKTRAPGAKMKGMQFKQVIKKEENENLRKTIKELRGTIQEMLLENENVPAMERLAQHELNLDVEGQKGLDAMVEQEATRVREEIEWEILAKRFLRDVLKRQCWDSLKVKSRSVKGFHCEHEVKNYPLKERTEKEVEELHRVQNMRKIEMAAITLLKSANEEEQDEEDLTTESDVVTGSFSAQFGYSNPYIYDQFSVRTTEQKINQIILLQDVIHRIKTAFNAEFDAVHRQKVQELNHVRERNRHIREILLELDMRQELWEPSLTNSEWPERLFTVDDSEIKAEKYLSPEQREEEERKELEEQKHLAAKGDNFMKKGLDDMMDGLLEVKKEEILKMEITQPEFALTKPDSHWSEEEKKVYKLYEKKTKDLSEKKEKYKKLRETEMKRLQVSTKDATKSFDETLMKLFQKKLKCEMAMYQDELMEEVKRHEEEVEMFLETYDTVVAEDKVLDKEFRTEFADVPAHVNHLYKLFKRRPRFLKLRTDNKPKEQALCGSLAPDALEKMSKAMEELDAPENIPSRLDSTVWKRFCLVRQAKIESEHKVNVKAFTLAKIQKLLQKRRVEKEAAQQEIKNLSDELKSLHKEKNRFLMDIMVQVIVKQGQVYTTDETADFPEYVLLHKGVVEDLNKTIRMLGGQNIASMVQRKDFRKNTFLLEWEHKHRRMQIEDLNNKARDIRRLHLSEEQQDYLNNSDQKSRVSTQVSILEKTIVYQEKAHLHNLQHYKNKIEEFTKQATMKEEINTVSEQQLPNMQVTVAERRHIFETTVKSQVASEGRHREIVQKKNLEDFAKAQAEELVLLWAEVERLRMKNFPSLDHLKQLSKENL
ncbi:cilia- and flagella-associated protein 43-like isoform X2 [Scophthalmus maximus]|uniref:cilia- and flagella-associated protein 43-like isoform X2 n=1 Tax=Scophthalmus maximus TaxID=52904 RepID=UPI001FA8DA11|nr:cilia- and flagella-associated protein 43-like isoform X2 [Scophthalmus maximus]